jgi:hypothetical protein
LIMGTLMLHCCCINRSTNRFCFKERQGSCRDFY